MISYLFWGVIVNIACAIALQRIILSKVNYSKAPLVLFSFVHSALLCIGIELITGLFNMHITIEQLAIIFCFIFIQYVVFIFMVNKNE